MLKRWLVVSLLSLVLLIIGAVSLLAASPASTQWLFNRFVLPAEIQLTCLDYDFTPTQPALHINTLCVHTPALTAQAKAFVWHPFDQQLHGDWFRLSLLSSAKTEAEPKAIQLPLLGELPPLPAMTIEATEFVYHPDAAPILFSTRFDGINQLTFKADWQLVMTLQQSKLRGQLKWSMADVMALLPATQREQLKGFQLTHLAEQPDIQSEFSFDGRVVQSQHELGISVQTALAGCPVSALIEGTLSAQFDLLNGTIMADTTQLPVYLPFDNCWKSHPALLPEVINWLSAQPDQQFLVELKQPLAWQRRRISVPAVSIKSLPTKQVEASFEEVLINMQDKFVSSQHVLNLNLLANQPNGFPSAWLTVSGRAQVSFAEQLALVNASYPQLNLKTDAFSYDDLSSGPIDLTSQLSFADTWQAKGSLAVSSMAYGEQTIKQLETPFDLAQVSPDQLTLTLKPSVQEFQRDDITVRQISAEWVANYDLTTLVASGNTRIGSAQVADIRIAPIQLAHQMNLRPKDKHYESQHQITAANQITAQLNTLGHRLEFNAPRQAASVLSPLLKQVVPELSISSGEWALKANLDINTQTGDGSLVVGDLTTEYATYTAANINLTTPFTLDSAGLHLREANLSVRKLGTGTEVTDVSAKLAVAGQTLSISALQGQLLGGRFELDKLVLGQPAQTAQLTLSGISLAEVMALQQQAGVNSQGVYLNGLISGRVPLQINDTKVSIQHATLANDGKAELRIINNQAFEALKAQQPKLKGQLSVLEHLEIDTLKSDVSMQADGLVDLTLTIQGRNPAQQLPVNFNYTHQQNLFTLLKSLRLADDMQSAIEKGIHPKRTTSQQKPGQP